MSAKITGLVWNMVSLGNDYEFEEWSVLLSLADCSLDDGSSSPAIEVIARKSGMLPEAVRLALVRLVEKRLVHIRRQGFKTIYTIMLELPDGETGTEPVL